jgi:hypothetical protein
MNQSGNNLQDNAKSQNHTKSQGTPPPNGNSDTSVIPPDPTQDIGILSSNNSNLRILYITLAIIIGILLLWIIIIIFTKEDPIKILNEMTNLAIQLKPVSDILSKHPLSTDPLNNPSIHVPI